MERPLSTLSKHPPLVVKTLDTLTPMFERAVDNRDMLRKPITPQESYALAVFDSGLALVNALDSLHQVAFYVSHYPATRTYRHHGPDKADWLRYHIENYHIRLVGVKDRAVNVVAAVYKITTRQGRDRPGYKDVLNSTAVKHTEVATCLEQLATQAAQSKEIRDEVIHQVSYEDEFLHRLELAALFRQDTDEKLHHASFLIELTTKFQTRELAKKLSAIAAETETKAAELLRALEPSYVAIVPTAKWASANDGAG